MKTKANVKVGYRFVTAALTVITSGCGVVGPEPAPGRPAQGNARTERETPPGSSAGAVHTDSPKLSGEDIYLRGVSPSADDIIAVLNDNVRVPASAVPCSNCHGIEGSGKTEGGMIASDIRWESLTKPYEVSAPGGRAHGAYDEASLRRAVTMGFDSSGHVLQAGMPRYQLSSRDLDELISYLKRLGRASSPGVTEKAIRIGAILPPTDSDGTAHDLTELLTGYFDEINRNGGIYDRLIELRFCMPAASEVNRADAMRVFCEREKPFALLGVPVTEADDENTAFSFMREVPLVVPLNRLGDTDRSANRNVFYLTGGFDRQARALVGFAKNQRLTANKKIGLVTGEGAVERKIAKQAAGELVGLVAEPLQMSIGGNRMDEIASRMRADRVEVVFCLVTGEGAAALLREAQQISWNPVVLALGVNLLDFVDSPPGFTGELYIALPYQPTDRTAEGLREYRELVARSGLTGGHEGIRMTFLASAKVVAEGLKEAGRRLTREALINALERPSGFETGLMPPVNYRDGRRIGAPGISIVQVHLDSRTCRPVEIWGGAASKEYGAPGR